MGRPAKFGEPANAALCVRVTPAQRQAIERVARENHASVADVIRDAVDSYVSDYSDAVVFCHTQSGDGGTVDTSN